MYFYVNYNMKHDIPNINEEEKRIQNHRRRVLSVGIDPVPEVGQPGVHPGDVGRAAHAPGHQPYHRPASALRLAHQRRPAVPRASVLAHLAAGADLALVQRKLVADASLFEVDGRLEVGVAAAAVHQRDVHLVLQELEGAVCGVLAPAGDPAARPAAVVEAEVELVIAGGQAHRVDGGAGQVDELVDGEDGEVVVEAGGIEAGMREDGDDCVLLGWDTLWRVEAAGVILTHLHLHLQQAENERVILK